MDVDFLKSVLDYNPETGAFTWKVKRASMAMPGQAAGTLDRSTGYLRIKISPRLYYAHRLAWLMVHGHFPEHEIDHINGVRSDNRIANLREATRHQNGANLPRKRNNTSGFPGVSFEGRKGKWAAYIHPKGKKRFLGYFETAEEAAAVRTAAERDHFGSFARIG